MFKSPLPGCSYRIIKKKLLGVSLGLLNSTLVYWISFFFFFLVLKVYLLKIDKRSTRVKESEVLKS